MSKKSQDVREVVVYVLIIIMKIYHNNSYHSYYGNYIIYRRYSEYSCCLSPTANVVIAVVVDVLFFGCDISLIR